MKECDGKLFFSTRTEYKIELNNNKKTKDARNLIWNLIFVFI